MKDYGKILSNFYFEIFTPAGLPLRATGYTKIMAEQGAPGGFGMFQFTDVEYMPDFAGEKENHTWKCYIRNFQVGKYLDLKWRDKEELYDVNDRAGKSRGFYLTAEPIKNGVRKWRIMTHSGHVLTPQANGLVLADSKNRSARWTMRLRSNHLDYRLTNIKYLDRLEETISSAPHNFMLNGEVITDAGVTVNSSQGVTFTKENTFEYGFTETLAVGATLKAEVSAPGGIAKSSAELRVDASLAATQKNTITETVSYHFADTINIAEGKDVKITAFIDWEENGEWPFEASFLIRGTATKTDGDAEADAMSSEEVKLVLQEKGFDGTFLESSSPATANAVINGVMTGSFGVTKHLITESEDILEEVF